MIPVRLIFGEKNKHVVEVDALEINVAVERTVAAFPLPVSSYRIALDTNLAQVVISMQGIIQDDQEQRTAGSPSSLSWDLSQSMPTTVPPNTSQYIALSKAFNYGWLYLMPDYWIRNSPNGRSNVIGLRFVPTLTSPRCGGSDNPTVAASFQYAENLTGSVIRQFRVRVDVPVGGFMFSPTNGNPAATLALLIKDALELATPITRTGQVDGQGGKNLDDAFEVSVNGSTVHIVNKHQSGRVVQFMAALQDSLGRTVPFRGHSFKASSPTSGRTKSAGDKAQDLLGLLANSKKDDDLLRGIQIPYHSLITSNEISPVVRNFFLTSGKVKPYQKGSTYNDKPSTLPMKIGEVEQGSDGLFKGLFETVNETLSIKGLGNIIGESWSQATGGSSTNSGGISVLPESFHLSKDGANNYYQFDLQMISADHIIGVI